MLRDALLPSWAARVGRAWFRWRSLSPVPLFLLLIIIPPQFTPSIFGFCLLVLGVALSESLRIWAVGYAGSATRTRGDLVSSLVTVGPYQFVRNPLYLANISLYTLTGLLFGSVILSAAIFVYSFSQYSFIVIYEESTLNSAIGPEYREYLRRPSRWFPRLVPGVPSGHLFNLRAALRSERSTFLCIAGMGLILVIRNFVLG